MWKSRFLCVFLSAGLVACAGTGRVAETPAVPRLPQLMAEADAAVKSGQIEQALASLRGAAKAYPGDKIPWLSMAQINFDHGKYGEAITAALEALQRDPHDKLANSIVVVSGLRLSTAAVAELAQQNNLNGPVRSEAHDLAKMLRTNLGEDVLVPAPAPAPARTAARVAKKAAVKAAPAAGGDPFGALK